MSKMPAKKKSCFQITSVTQAQVAASSITDDTESLDDPDESRTEDVSSEIFDVSRADLGVCDRSSSEETLNNAGEQQEVQPATTGPINGGPYKSVGTGRTTPHGLGGSVPAPAQAHVPSSAPTLPTSVCPPALVSGSCSSRFRVIKLDHGSGEPFRRGRWTCTEFYERDSDSSRTVDSIKPNVTHDPSVDRDSGLGTTSTSVVTSSAFSSQTVENTVDSGHLVTPPNPSEPLQQSYSSIPQIGSVTSAFQPTGYSTTASQKPHPAAPQTLTSNNLNGIQQGPVQQKSPILPPATQAQQFACSTHTSGVSTSQPEYCPQHFSSSTQNFPVTSVSAGPATSRGPSPLVSCAGPGGQGLGICAQVGEGVVASGLHLQVASPPVSAPILTGSGQQQPVIQTQLLGGLSVAPVPSVPTTHSNVPNVPATVPSTTNTPMGLPSLAPGTRGLVWPQGAHSGATTGHPSSVSNQAEDNRQMFDVLTQSSAGVVLGKDGVKPYITERLTLPAPAVNTLFGIPISMDGDDDRNPSTAFFQAFWPRRLQGSKPANTSASGASVVAIDNKIEQAMDLVKSHLMYAVREEVEVLKEQIKELFERNSVLERENAVLKSLANSEQLGQLSNQLSPGSSTPSPSQQQHPASTNGSSSSSPAHFESVRSVPHQPNITSA